MVSDGESDGRRSGDRKTKGSYAPSTIALFRA
jgi:hypothetical protein